MKTAFLITARLKSTRLPKKILLEVARKPLIVHMLDRIKNAMSIDKIIICNLYIFDGHVKTIFYK